MAKKIDINGLDHFKEKENAMIASEYSSSKTYAVGDYVYYAGTLYCCTTAITTAEAWTSGHWAAAKLADDCSSLKTAITMKTPQSIGTRTDNSYWSVETSTAVRTTFTGSFSTWDALPVVAGEIWAVKASQGGSDKTRIWVVTDDELNIISKADDNYGTGVYEDTFVIPENGTKLLISSYKSGASSPYAWAYRITSSNDNYVAVPFYDYGMTPNKFWNTEGSKAVLADIASSWWASNEIPVAEGERFIVCGQQYNTHKTRIWITTDDELNIISKASDLYSAGYYNNEVVIPRGATKLLITSTYYTSGARKPFVIKYVPYRQITEKVLYGRKLSVLGDSISAYTGTIPVGNTAYYTGNNAGVSNSSQMWWSILCDKTGMTPCVINGLSGSGITQLEDEQHVSIPPMSDDTRCLALHNSNDYPNVIIIAGGLNDYTYAQSAQSEPAEWDGKTVPVIGSNFTETYACMIKKIQTAYPKAIIVALSTWFSMRGVDNGYTLTHTVGSNVWTQQDYNNAIKSVAEQMHIPYIDVSNIGFNRNNFYPIFASDSSTIPTHPNFAGQYVMGAAIAEKLPSLVKAFISP